MFKKKKLYGEHSKESETVTAIGQKLQEILLASLDFIMQVKTFCLGNVTNCAQCKIKKCKTAALKSK